MKKSFFLRIALSVILLMHSLFSIIYGDVNNFGLYLNSIGFSTLGLYIAWSVKLTHLVSAPLIWIDKYVKTVAVAVANITIFVIGIYYVHWQNGWFVVGGGSNGIEFNFLLIFCFLNLLFPEVSFSFKKNK